MLMDQIFSQTVALIELMAFFITPLDIKKNKQASFYNT